MKDIKNEAHLIANKLRTDHLKQQSRLRQLNDEEKLELKLLLEGYNFADINPTLSA